MRALRKLLGLSTSRAQNTNLMEPTSMAAYGAMTSAQQSMIAQALFAAADERRKLDKAS